MPLPKLKVLFESVNDKNRLVGALKKNDIEAAKSAITSMMRGKRTQLTPANEMGMEDSEFKALAKALQDGDIEGAKKAVGIGSMPLRGPFASVMEPKSDGPEEEEDDFQHNDDVFSAMRR
jgi:hypothetical protein